MTRDEAGASRPSNLVEAALRGLEPCGVERLDGLGGARDEPLGVVVRLEIGENVVGERAAVSPLGPADADPQPEEVLGAERLRDRAQAVVTRGPAALARLETSEVEVALVV